MCNTKSQTIDKYNNQFIFPCLNFGLLFLVSQDVWLRLFIHFAHIIAHVCYMAKYM